MSPTESQAFEAGQFSTEHTRVKAVRWILGTCFVLVLMGRASLVRGERRAGWHFLAALVLVVAYEVVWRQFLVHQISSSRSIGGTLWRRRTIAESLIPTLCLLFQAHTHSIGLARAITSPLVLTYFLFILLSILRLDRRLSILCGCVCACGYTASAAYAFLRAPAISESGKLWAYATWFSSAALLVLGGFVAGVVVDQIRLHVQATSEEAAARSKDLRDLNIARWIQEGLLPTQSPVVKGFDIAGWIQPAPDTGADYFDWLILPDGQIVITVADVSGHGIGPALCMSGCRAYVRAGFNSATDLPHLLSGMNRALKQDSPPEQFVTMAVGLLDARAAVLELISAGHGPLLFYIAAENRFRSYDAQGMPLGLMTSVRYNTPHRLQFAPGDILVIVTDGFVEWANPQGEEFGQHRLKELIRGRQNASAEAIISDLYAAVSRFAGSTPQVDDLTAVVVKRLTPAPLEEDREN